jgi:predicted Zn-dependent protease
LRPHQVEDVVAEAEQAAADGSPAEDAAPLLATSDPTAFGRQGAGLGGPAWDAPVGGTEIGVFSAFAGDLGSVFGAAEAGGRKLYGFAEHTLTTTFLGTSAGLRLRHDQPTGRVDLNAKSADLTASTWAGCATRDFTDVDVAALDAGAQQRLDWARRKIDLPAGRYETLLPPAAVADLLVYLYWSAAAKDALDGRSVFSKPGGGTRVGERLAALPVTLRSDPALPGLGAAPFAIAHASGRDSSVFDNGLDDMVARTGRGLLLTCLWYIREVDPQTLLLTGLTRDGVYLVENGEVTGAVNNFRFNESPVGMLNRLTEVGGTVPALPREWGDYFTRCAMPPARVEGFNMSSVSQAS